MKLTKKAETILRHLAYVWEATNMVKTDDTPFIISGKYLRQAAEIVEAIDSHPEPPASPADFDEGGPMGEPYYQE